MKTKLMSSAVVAVCALLVTASPVRNAEPTPSAPTVASAVVMPPSQLFTVMNEAEMATVTGGAPKWMKYVTCAASGVTVQVAFGVPGLGVGAAAICRFVWDILVTE